MAYIERANQKIHNIISFNIQQPVIQYLATQDIRIRPLCRQIIRSIQGGSREKGLIVLTTVIIWQNGHGHFDAGLFEGQISRKKGLCHAHRLRPIDTHLALYTMLYNNSAKNRYAEPVLNKTKHISNIRD